jgi:hypothetical protein
MMEKGLRNRQRRSGHAQPRGYFVRVFLQPTRLRFFSLAETVRELQLSAGKVMRLVRNEKLEPVLYKDGSLAGITMRSVEIFLSEKREG